MKVWMHVSAEMLPTPSNTQVVATPAHPAITYIHVAKCEICRDLRMFFC